MGSAQGSVAGAGKISNGKLEPGSDEWWFQRLSKALSKRQAEKHELGDWLNGVPPVAMPDAKVDAGFKRLQELARLTLAELIVNAATARMKPAGFKTGAEDDENGDKEAARLMRRNQMKIQFADLIEWFSVYGHSYLITGEHPDTKKKALITAEHPFQVITEDDPIVRGRSVAALKIYRDDLNERDVAVLYRPGYVRVAYKTGVISQLPKKNQKNWAIDVRTWDLQKKESTGGSIVPVFHCENRNGEGEFEKHLETLRRINHTILQRMIIVAFQAFKQRGIKGVPNTDKDGALIDYSDIFKADPGALWLLPATAEMWESGQADIGPVLTAVKDDMTYLAATSQTPLYTFVADAAGGSAEGAALQREGLLFKVEDRMDRLDYPICAAFAEAFRVEGDDARSGLDDIQLIWKSPKRTSMSEMGSAGQAAAAGGLPWRYIMTEIFQLTPEQMADAEKERKKDALLAAAAAPPTVPGTPGKPAPSGKRPGTSTESTVGTV